MELLLIARVLILATVFSAIMVDDTEAATQGSISYLHGDGYVVGDNTRNITRFDVLYEAINQFKIKQEF